MRRSTIIAAYAVAVIAAWGLLGALVFVSNVGALPALDRRALVAYALLFLAPGLTFVPLARWARAPFYDVEAIAGWAAFGFVFTFLAPRPSPSLAQFLIFLLPLTVALASICTLLAYLVGLRALRGDPRRRDFVRARREGYLCALCVVALALLRGIGVLTPASGALLVVVCALTESLLLARPAFGGERVGVRSVRGS